METLFRNLLTASFHGSLVILVICLLRPLVKKGPKKFLCLLWMLAFIRLILPFQIETSLSLQPKPEVFSKPQQIQSVEVPQPITPAPVGQIAEESNHTAQPQFQQSHSVADIPEAPAVEPETPVSLMAVFGWIWISAASVFLVYSIWSYSRLRLLVQDAIRVRDAWESEHIETAFILGFIRPKIYIPMGMDFQTRRYILAHERTHLEKGDQWLKLFGYITLALHWFNPLVWVAYILLCKDIELACDERVVQFMDLAERKAYSSALLACSANHIHLTACPVAFGEVSVKERIKAVLHYKKPAFWISLVCVVAIIFVVVCLMTSRPDKEIPQNSEVTEAAVKNSEKKTGKTEGPVANLSVSEIQYTCEQALKELMDRESYYIFAEYTAESDNPQYLDYTSQQEYRRYGTDYMFVPLPHDGKIDSIGFLGYGDQTAMYNGGFWVADDTPLPVDPNENLHTYDPKNMTVSFPEGTGVIDGSTLAFHAEWKNPRKFSDHVYTGTVRYHFQEDGTLEKIEQEYSYLDSDNLEHRGVNTLTIMIEDPETTRAKITDAGESVLTHEEFNAALVKQDQVTELPSNKTEYDRNFSLGSSEMGWKLLDGKWFMKFGTRNAAPTSTDLWYEFSGDYDNSGIAGSVVTDQEFFIEILENGKWVKYPMAQEGRNVLTSQKVSAGTTIHLDWEDSYGALPGGFYRVGMYYTLTTDSGETDRQFCYAKFRLYDSQMNALLTKCQHSLQALLDGDSYHIKSSNMYIQHMENEEDPHYRMEESWKSGNTYLNLSSAYLYEGNVALGYSGLLHKDGVGYTLDFENGDPNGTMTMHTADFVDLDMMKFWTSDYTIYDSLVTDVVQDGNTVKILNIYDFDDKYDHTEIVFHFDRNGNIQKMQNILVDNEGKNHINNEMTVFTDSAQKISDKIQSLSAGKTPGFSYQEETKGIQSGNEGVRTKSFVNSSPTTMADTLAVIDRAKQDCTLPAAGGMEPGTNMAEVFYDADAKMWKVEFTASWDNRIYQAVYLNDQGITQLTVTKELPSEF